MPPGFTRGLGAVLSEPDDRDFALQLVPTLTYPARYLLSLTGVPVLDQGNTGTCVAHAADSVRMWLEYRDKTPIYTWVTEPAVLTLYDWCKLADRDPDPYRTHGTSLRTVMGVLRTRGTPLSLPKHNGGRIAAYYGVATSVSSMKTALMTHGPLLVASNWDLNWFYVPTSLVMKAPVGDWVGGHAYMIWGWDDNVNGGCWLMRNSWGRGINGWTSTGNAYMAYRYFAAAAPEAWWLADILNDPIT